MHHPSRRGFHRDDSSGLWLPEHPSCVVPELAPRRGIFGARRRGYDGGGGGGGAANPPTLVQNPYYSDASSASSTSVTLSSTGAGHALILVLFFTDHGDPGVSSVLCNDGSSTPMSQIGTTQTALGGQTAMSIWGVFNIPSAITQVTVSHGSTPYHHAMVFELSGTPTTAGAAVDVESGDAQSNTGSAMSIPLVTTEPKSYIMGAFTCDRSFGNPGTDFTKQDAVGGHGWQWKSVTGGTTVFDGTQTAPPDHPWGAVAVAIKGI